MGHNKQERKRKEKEIKGKKEEQKISKQRRIRGDDVGGDNHVQEARLFSRLLCLFFFSSTP